MDLNSYISGFSDGEGCFCVSFNFRNKLNTGLEVRPSFSISQHQNNLNLLKLIRKQFNCGSIRYSKRDSSYKFEVREISQLNGKIIPHFIRYPLMGIKLNDFRKFKQICLMMKSNLHRNLSGLQTIINLAYDMNHGKRKYSKDVLLKRIAR